MTVWLLDTLLYTGLLIAVVLLVRRPAARWLGPQFAYALWALPFLRLLMPPIVLPASFAPKPEPVQAIAAPVAEWSGAAAVAPAADALAATVPLSASATMPASAPAWNWGELAGVALSVWLGVALAFLAWRIVTYRRMRRELLAQARPVGETGKVRLVETPAVAAPVAFGVFDKVIALPPLFMAQNDRLARDLAIEHELAHHRGHDLLANFAAQALLALHWFNPLAWLGWRAMRRDQEAACDARVLAGRDRAERACYAALIAKAAAGRRALGSGGALPFNGALAAPMAGPVFGEKSIIHRLRNLPMSDVTRRRRWLGHGLITAGAIALPLTASFSYSAGAQVLEPPTPPAPPAPQVAPAPPAPPAPPAAPEAAEPHVRTFVLRRESADGEEPAPVVRRFTLRREGDVPPLPPMPVPPRFEFHAWSDPADPEFEAKMEEFGRQMEAWGKKLGEQYAAEAEATALAARNAPEVVQSCDENDRHPALAENGRPRVVICQRKVELAARTGLRSARDAIARNRAISDEVRAEILRDLDGEIARIERGEN
jgi:beta-lactamase regulating signal transducer with metallopeptidase domain